MTQTHFTAQHTPINPSWHGSEALRRHWPVQFIVTPDNRGNCGKVRPRPRYCPDRTDLTASSGGGSCPRGGRRSFCGHAILRADDRSAIPERCKILVSPLNTLLARLSGCSDDDKGSGRFDDIGKVPFEVPAWLAETAYRNPDNICHTAATRAFGCTGQPAYTYFNEHKEIGQHFGGFMVAYSAGRPSFWDSSFYPVRDRLGGGGGDDDDVLLVDIGGGDGHDLADFRAAFPDLKGRLILQELSHVVERIQNESYEPMVHDWNMEQPVKGAFV